MYGKKARNFIHVIDYSSYFLNWDTWHLRNKSSEYTSTYRATFGILLFQVVYIGPEMMCTVDGLHFNSIYNARVRSQNHAGESEYSELVSLQTAEGNFFV